MLAFTGLGTPGNALAPDAPASPSPVPGITGGVTCHRANGTTVGCTGAGVADLLFRQLQSNINAVNARVGSSLRAPFPNTWQTPLIVNGVIDATTVTALRALCSLGGALATSPDVTGPPAQMTNPQVTSDTLIEWVANAAGHYATALLTFLPATKFSSVVRPTTVFVPPSTGASPPIIPVGSMPTGTAPGTPGTNTVDPSQACMAAGLVWDPSTGTCNAGSFQPPVNTPPAVSQQVPAPDTQVFPGDNQPIPVTPTGPNLLLIGGLAAGAVGFAIWFLRR